MSTPTYLQQLDIFVSSPNDVPDERQAVIRAIDRLNALHHINHTYRLRALTYEDIVPPESGAPAQAIVDRYMQATSCYLFICILWSRIGTPFTHPDGRQFPSGTVYEFTSAYTALQQHGWPRILLYRRTDPNPAADPDQQHQVEAFFQQIERGKSLAGIYKPYSYDDHAFEEMIFRHIEHILSQYPPKGTAMPANAQPSSESESYHVTAGDHGTAVGRVDGDFVQAHHVQIDRRTYYGDSPEIKLLKTKIEDLQEQIAQKSEALKEARFHDQVQANIHRDRSGQISPNTIIAIVGVLVGAGLAAAIEPLLGIIAAIVLGIGAVLWLQNQPASAPPPAPRATAIEADIQQAQHQLQTQQAELKRLRQMAADEQHIP